MSESFPGIRATARQGTEIEIEGRRYRAFCGSDYLGLGRDPRVIEAARAALLQYGVSSSASRWTSGETAAHRACEEVAADSFATEDAVLLPIGYLAAQAVLDALPEHRAWRLHVHAHAALRQAAQFIAGSDRGSIAENWQSIKDLARGLEVDASGALADACFPAHGEFLDLAAVHPVLRPVNAPLVLDEAHTLGVIGPHGRGHAARAGLGESDAVYVVGTLSKAFGSHGGLVIGTRAFCDEIRSRAALYVGATPVPAALATAAAKAIEIAKNEPWRRELLQQLSAQMRAGLLALGLPAPAPELPIFILSRGLDAAEAQRTLEAAECFAPLSRYPGLPVGGALAITLSASHTTDDVARLLELLETCRNSAS